LKFSAVYRCAYVVCGGLWKGGLGPWVFHVYATGRCLSSVGLTLSCRRRHQAVNVIHTKL